MSRSVLVDQALIEVALVNVLENALRYSGRDDPVEVESRGRVRTRPRRGRRPRARGAGDGP